MPTYEYKCDACGIEFERFQPITAAAIKRCPECGKAKVRRLISTGAGLIFKGSGFYITDYRDKSYSDKAKAESAGGEAKTETKTDSTAQPQGDAKPAQNKPPETKSESKSESKPAGETKPPPRKKK